MPAGAAALLILVMAVSASASSVFTVPAGGDLQAVLDMAPAGSVVLLEPGGTYRGPFVIRRPVTIRTSGNLPAARVTPAWSGTLAILESPTNEPALRLAPGVGHVSLVALEFAANGSAAGTSIEVGSNGETDASRQPHDVLLDRLLVRGHPVRGQKRGLSLHGSRITVTRSHISDFKLKGQDTQAIWINNGWGPYHIEDNYLEASGENIMAGGDTPRIQNLVPSDITIIGNSIVKPLHWKPEGWTVKNLLELKSARRVTIRGNHLAGSWVSGQVGYGILLTPKDQYGRAPWTTVQDVLVESNVVHEVAEAIRVLGDDHAHPAVRAERIVIRNNLLIVDRLAHGGSGRCLTVGRAPQQIEFSGNTCIANGPSAIYTFRGGDLRVVLGAVFRRNVFAHNEYGFSGDEATAGGLALLAPHYPDLVFADNLIGGGTGARYPGNHVISVADFRAQFADYAGGDFRLTDASRQRFATRDGGVLGADLNRPAAAASAAPVPPAVPEVAVPPGSGAPPAASGAAVRSAVPRARPSTPARVPTRGTSTAPADRPVVRDDVPSRVAAVGSGQTAAASSAPASVSSTLAWRANDAVNAASAAVAGSGTAQAPSISLAVSVPPDAVPAHATVTIAAQAAHLAADLVRIDIYIDRAPLGSATRAPFDIEWQVPAPGTYRLVAVATDSGGAVITSAPVDVTVR